MASLFDELSSGQSSVATTTTHASPSQHPMAELNQLTIQWQLWIESNDSSDGPISIGEAFSLHNPDVDTHSWSLPISMNDQASRVFFEVPNVSSFPSISHSTANGRRKSCLPHQQLGILVRSAGFPQPEHQSDTDDNDNEFSHHNSRSFHYSHKSGRNRSLSLKRSLFSFLSPIDVPIIASSSTPFIKQIVSSPGSSVPGTVSANDDGSHYCLTNSGNLFHWTGVPESASSLVPLTWPVSSPPRISRVSCGLTQSVLLSDEGLVWFLSRDSLDGHTVYGDTNCPVRYDDVDEPIDFIDCGCDHVLLISRSRRIFEVRDGITDEVPSSHLTNDWIVIDCGAGDSFNVIVLKHQSTDQCRILTWGSDSSYGRLGRYCDESTANIPYDIDIDALGPTVSVTQLCVSGSGACVLCIQDNLSLCDSLSTSVWLWGRVPEYKAEQTDDNVDCNLHRWLEPWNIEGKAKDDEKHIYANVKRGSSFCNQKIRIVSICLSTNGLGIMTVVTNGANSNETSNTNVPRLDLGCMTTKSTKANVNEFWQKWGNSDQTSNRIDIINLSDRPSKEISELQLNSQSSMSARTKLILTPGMVVSTTDSLPHSSRLLQNPVHNSSVQRRFVVRHGFTQDPPRLVQSGRIEDNRWLTAISEIGKNSSLAAVKEVWENVTTDMRENGLLRFSSKVGLNQSNNENIEERCDEFSVVQRLIGPEWQEGELQTLRCLLIQLEQYRRTACAFWQSYLVYAEFNILPPEKRRHTTLKDLRSMYLGIRRKFLEYFGITDELDLFNLYQNPNTILWKLRNEDYEDFMRPPKGCPVIQRISNSQWMLSGSCYLPGKSMIAQTSHTDLLRKLSLDRLISPLHQDNLVMPDSDQGIRLRRLRREAFIKSGYSCDGEDVPIQDWEISQNSISVVDAMYSFSLMPVSSVSKMYLGIYRSCLVALKVSVVGESSDDELRNRLFEIFVHQKLRHPNILLFIGAVIRGPQVVLVTELARGSLWNLLHESEVDLSLADSVKIASDIAYGISYLHHHPISPYIHRDIKSSNVVLTGYPTVTAKLCDFECLKVLSPGFPINSQHNELARFPLLSAFGITDDKPLRSFRTLKENSIATFFGPDDTAGPDQHSSDDGRSIEVSYGSGSVGTLQWMAPEMINTKISFSKYNPRNVCIRKSISSTITQQLQHLGSYPTIKLRKPELVDNRIEQNNTIIEQSYSEKVDIYSYGILLWELFSRNPPYLGVDAEAVANLVRFRDLRIPCDSVPPACASIISVCLHADPVNRPDILTIIECLCEWDRQIKKSGAIEAIRDAFSNFTKSGN